MDEKQKKEDRLRIGSATLSVLVSSLLMSLKFWGFHITRSQAVFSDAMESIVNVIASILAFFVVYIAAQPADEDHPYGHGKLEYFSAAFEGGLITFAAVIIFFEAAQQIWTVATPKNLDQGILVVFGAGVINLLLGLFLLMTSSRMQSSALKASAHHVLSDFWTSAGVIVGLFLAKVTGLWWLDSLTAIFIGLFLGWTGIKLVRSAGGALMEEKDKVLLEHLVDLFNQYRTPDIIQIHHVRIIRSGRFHHIDAHVVCPEFWDIAIAHQRTNDFEFKIIDGYQYGGEIAFHVDPCRRVYCRQCAVEKCPIRRHPLESQNQFSLVELMNPNEPF